MSSLRSRQGQFQQRIKFHRKSRQDLASGRLLCYNDVGVISMKLTLEQIKSVTLGAQRVELDGEAVRFFRFCHADDQAMKTKNSFNPAGVQLLFDTDATNLSLDVFTEDLTTIRSYFAIDVFANGNYIGAIQNLSDADAVGNYGEGKHPLGNFSGDFSLGSGDKQVRIVLPHSVSMKLERMELTDASYLHPVKKNTVILAYGDSITQGYDALHPTNTYAMRLADKFDAEIFNKGIGGASFYPSFAAVKNGIDPDFIIIAYGTNDWTSHTYERISDDAKAFISNVVANYPEKPIFVISPIWRWDIDTEKPSGRFGAVEEILLNICQNHKNVTFISGTDLIPHDGAYYGDLRLHPSDKGFEQYFLNLVKQIKLAL